MTHKLRGDVVYLDPSGRDDSNRRRAMRAIVVSSFGLLLTSAFEISVSVLSGSVALLSDRLRGLLPGRLGAEEVRYLPKWGWLIVSLVSIPLGGIIYLIFGRVR